MDQKTDGTRAGLQRMWAPEAMLPWILGLAAISCPFFLWHEAMPAWSALWFLVLLIFPAVEDGMTGYISDGWSLAIGISGVGERLLAGDVLGLWGAAVILAFLGGLFLWRGEALGEGDIWLGSAIACWLPGCLSILFLWLAFFIGGMAGIWHLCRGGRGRDSLPFGPFLCLGGGVAYVWGEKILAWYGTFF